MNKIFHYKTVRAIVSLSLLASLCWNAILLKDSDKLNLDALKWAVKSLTFKYSDLVNGKISLIQLDRNLSGQTHLEVGSNDVVYKAVISQASKYYSIFGLEPIKGFDGLPKGLPKRVAECSAKLGLDKNLYFVSHSKSPKSQYVFFRGDSQLSALTGSFLEQDNCVIASEITVQKSATSWLIRQDTAIDFSANDLPAHFSISNSGVAVLISRLGKLRYINLKGKKIEVSPATDLNLNLLESQAHTHFGVKSVLVGDDFLYIAAARNDNSCNRLEIYSLPVSKKKVDLQPAHSRTIYKSPGCFHAATTELNAIGGRLIFGNASQSEILFSLGNAEIWTGLEEIEANKHYGVILKLNLLSGDTSVISTGHRNPQGLCVNLKGIYETEQGPDGGDELNLIQQGKNYGWPQESYGVPYGDFYSTVHTQRQFGSHGTSTKPLLSWVPAIAIGDLICPNGDNAHPWGLSFIAATLKDMSLRRMVLDGGAIRVDERIPMKERIRDIKFDSAGNLISLSDAGSIIVIHFIPREN